MTDKLRSRSIRGAKARELLESELMVEAFDLTTRTYLDKWMATHPADTAMREHLWRCIQTVADVKKHLSTAAADGKLADAEIGKL